MTPDSTVRKIRSRTGQALSGSIFLHKVNPRGNKRTVEPLFYLTNTAFRVIYRLPKRKGVPMIMADKEKKTFKAAIYCRVGRIENLGPHEREKALVWKGGKACEDKDNQGGGNTSRG